MNNKINWYIIRTQASKENYVSERLEKEKENGFLKDKVTDIIVPTQTVISSKDGKKTKKDKIMFPGYVFVGCDDLGTLKDVINTISGASGFLKSRSGEVQKLSQSEVNRMLGIQKESKLKNIENPYVVGELVKITDGAFNTFEGTIDNIVEDKIKLSVLIFGRKTNIDLTINQIAKI